MAKSKSKKLKSIPKFKNDDEERAFWASHSSVDYFDWKRAKRVVFPNLKLSSRSITVRLPVALIEDLKLLANRKDVPYQSLMKVYLSERVHLEHEKIKKAS
jgi:predicted DNA binding CopG/RHH family protein